MAQTTVTATITDAGGNPASSGTVTFKLSPNSAGLAYRVAGTDVIAPQQVIGGIDSSGHLLNSDLSGPCLVWGNPAILPANTMYTVEIAPNNIVTSEINSVLIFGPTYDLSNIQFAPVTDMVPQQTTIRPSPVETNLVPAAGHVFNIGSQQLPYANVFADEFTLTGGATLGGTNDVQASFPFATVTVLNAGTTTLSTIFSDRAMTVPQANPFSADGKGFWSFYAAAGYYDVQFSGDGISVPYKLTDLEIPEFIILNVKDAPFSAVGDGVHDDTSAILSAMNVAGTAPSGAKVYFPAGTYLISAAISMPSKVTVEGDGAARTTINQATPYTPGLSPNNGTGDQTVRNLTLNGNYTHTTFPNGSTAIASGFIGSDMTSTNDADWKGSRLLLENCTIQNWGFGGIWVAPDSKVLNCRFLNIYNEPILIGGDNAVIANNYINGCASWGIDVNGNFARVEFNILRSTGKSAAHEPGPNGDGGAILVYAATRSTGITGVKVIGNDIDGSEVNGISVFANNTNACRDHIVAFNTVRNCWTSPPANITPGWVQAAIKVHSDILPSYPIQRVQMIGNNVGPSNINGISVLDSLYVNVSNNIVTGITVSSSTDTSNTQGMGIVVGTHTSGAVSPVAPQDISIQGNTIIGQAMSGILVQGVSADLIKHVKINGNTITNPSGATNYITALHLNNVFDFIVEGNVLDLNASYDGMVMDGNAVNGVVSGNRITGGHGGIGYATSVNDIAIVNNNGVGNAGGSVSITQNVPGIVIRGNYPTNPVGSVIFAGFAQPTVPASGTILTNPFGVDSFVIITAGTDVVTTIALGVASSMSNVSTASPLIAANGVAMVFVPAVYQIRLTYPTVAPAWVWFAN